MCPNAGEFSGHGLFALAESCAAKGIFSTFLGIGLDFDTELVDRVTAGVRGSSYESVKSAASFQKRMARDFDYSVFPIVFDATVCVRSAGFTIAGAYGSPEAYKPPKDTKTVHQEAIPTTTASVQQQQQQQLPPCHEVDLLKVGTLFPSAKEEGGMTLGGMFLVKLERTAVDSGQGGGGGVGVVDDLQPTAGGGVVQNAADRQRVEVVRTFRDRAGNKHEEHDEATLPENVQLPYWETPSVRKAVLLARFVDAVQEFAHTQDREPLAAFAAHFKAEMDVIGDKALAKDYRTLLNLIEPASDARSFQPLLPPPALARPFPTGWRRPIM
jgi:hypothetical protein